MATILQLGPTDEIPAWTYAVIAFASYLMLVAFPWLSTGSWPHRVRALTASAVIVGGTVAVLDIAPIGAPGPIKVWILAPVAFCVVAASVAYPWLLLSGDPGWAHPAQAIRNSPDG